MGFPFLSFRGKRGISTLPTRFLAEPVPPEAKCLVRQAVELPFNPTIPHRAILFLSVILSFAADLWAVNSRFASQAQNDKKTSPALSGWPESYLIRYGIVRYSTDCIQDNPISNL